MAKKLSFSHIDAQQALERLVGHTSGATFGYDLLRIFCGYGDASIKRIVEGKGNDAKDGTTLLVKRLLAYRPVEAGADLHECLDAMREDPQITKREPRLYVVSDGKTVVAYDPKEGDLYECDIDVMWKDFEFFKPLAGIEKFRNVEEAEADVKSAEMMAKIYDDIRRYNDVNDEAAMRCLNIFMSRLLFCYFAEDTGLFPYDNMFTNAIKGSTKADGSDLGEFIGQLFEAMTTADDDAVRSQWAKPIADFPYVNGGLFRERIPIPTLSRRTRILMLKCGEYDWREINPDIFGSMIQAVVSPNQRSGLGMHYTSVPNIMKVIRPLFLDALTDEFVRNGDNAKQLNKLLDRLSRIKFFDPACGSGNFLIIAYKRVRELEIAIWERLCQLNQGQTAMPFSVIKLTQFYGIEIDDYARDTATLSLWLAEHQMNNRFYAKFGTRPNPLPLHQSGNIVCGNACRLDWNTVCPHSADDEVYILGNPPYLGSKLQNSEQKEDLRIAMPTLKENKSMDYISAWFWKGSNYIKGSNSRFAFVTTNSLCQGEQVGMLWPHIFNLGLTIFFARTSFKWSNNAKYNAGVTCAIVGVANDYTGRRHLYNETENKCYQVANINPYLSEGVNLVVAKSHLLSNVPQMVFGSMPRDGGYLILSENEAVRLMEAFPIANKIIKHYIGSQELIQGLSRYCLWIEENNKDIAYSIEPIRIRLDKVAEERSMSDAESTRAYADRPYLFVQRAYKPTDAIIVPAVSSERREYIPIGYVCADTVISNLAFAVYDAELWLFGLLTSKMHNIWVRAVGGRLKTDYRYSATLCYNTFPFPKITAEQKAKIAELAEEVIVVRAAHSEMTLGEMYNPETMPLDLRTAHRGLDAEVERCYRPEPFSTDEERLEYLFKAYERMTKKK